MLFDENIPRKSSRDPILAAVPKARVFFKVDETRAFGTSARFTSQIPAVADGYTEAAHPR